MTTPPTNRRHIMSLAGPAKHCTNGISDPMPRRVIPTGAIFQTRHHVLYLSTMNITTSGTSRTLPNMICTTGGREMEPISGVPGHLIQACHWYLAWHCNLVVRQYIFAPTSQ